MIKTLFILLVTTSKLWQKHGADGKQSRLGFRWTSCTTGKERRSHPAMVEGWMAWRHEAPIPQGLSVIEAASATTSSYRRLLKGLHPWANFHDNGLAYSEHQHRGHQGLTEGHWVIRARARSEAFSQVEALVISTVPLLSSPHTQCADLVLP